MKLVVGSRGFVGKALCDKLKSEGILFCEMNSENNGILDYANFKQFSAMDISHVYHLGSATFVPDSWKDPINFHNVITNGTLNVLKFCNEKKASLTYVSAYVYGNQTMQPIVEEALKIKSNPYAHAKLIAEKHCEYFRDFLDLKVNILRPFNIYGVGQKENFFVPWLVKQAIESDEIHLENTITKRDFIYIDDMVDALILSSKFVGNGDIYNVGTGVSSSVELILKLVEEILSKKITVVTKNNLRENEMLDTVASIKKIERDLSWSPKINMRTGLELVIKQLSNKWST